MLKDNEVDITNIDITQIDINSDELVNNEVELTTDLTEEVESSEELLSTKSIAEPIIDIRKNKIDTENKTDISNKFNTMLNSMFSKFTETNPLECVIFFIDSKSSLNDSYTKGYKHSIYTIINKLKSEESLKNAKLLFIPISVNSELLKLKKVISKNTPIRKAVDLPTYSYYNKCIEIRNLLISEGMVDIYTDTAVIEEYLKLMKSKISIPEKSLIILLSDGICNCSGYMGNLFKRYCAFDNVFYFLTSFKIDSNLRSLVDKHSATIDQRSICGINTIKSKYVAK